MHIVWQIWAIMNEDFTQPTVLYTFLEEPDSAAHARLQQYKDAFPNKQVVLKQIEVTEDNLEYQDTYKLKALELLRLCIDDEPINEETIRLNLKICRQLKPEFYVWFTEGQMIQWYIAQHTEITTN